MVEDDREIRQGLYPGTGANVSTANGGGKPKTEFYWQLATHLFTDHDDDGALFANTRQSSTKKAREPWILKIKNQLSRFVSIQMTALLQLTNSPASMADEVRKHSKTLGETGQGLTSEESIWEGTELARTWGEYFVLCDTLPNDYLPLSRSRSQKDMSVVLPNEANHWRAPKRKACWDWE